MTDRVIVAVKYTPVAPTGELRKAVGAFLRYVQYRDKHGDETTTEPERKVDGMLRYVAHRDRASGHGRLFDAGGTAGDEERRALAAFIARAARATTPQVAHDENGDLVDRRRAVYRFVISPERASGLDLRQLTGAAVKQLEADAGGQLRWIAAEHRNTAHPHVHLIVAGFRETEPGTFRSLVLTKARLQRLKDSTVAELERQRGLRPARDQSLSATTSASQAPEHRVVTANRRDAPAHRPVRVETVRHRTERTTGRPLRLLNPSTLRRLAAKYRREAEREASERRLGWEAVA